VKLGEAERIRRDSGFRRTGDADLAGGVAFVASAFAFRGAAFFVLFRLAIVSSSFASG